MRVVKVAVEQAAYHFDKLYSYVADESMPLARGCRVLVPFGKGNRCRQGIVMELSEEAPTAKLKPITEVLDEEPILSEELLKLAMWMRNRTFCTVFDAVRAMLPTGLYWNVKPVFLPVRPLPEGAETSMSDEELAVYKLACSMSSRLSDGVPGDKLLRCAGLAEQSNLLDTMLRRGWLTRSDDAFRRLGDATRRMARLSVPPEELEEALTAAKCSPKQRAVVSLLTEAGTASVKELCYLAGVTEAVVTTLVKKSLVELYDQEWLRTPTKSVGTSAAPLVLEGKQVQALEELTVRYREDAASCALLYGVTGSGKTQVYMSLIDRVIADGKQVLVLVPEIALTPQVTEKFLQRYGSRVAVLHSGLSVGERMDEWKRIHRGDATIVVGTRSAVFAPVNRLGLIVIDEEQEHTYKSESTPRYHAREVAKFRCAEHKALLLLTSATPSVESYHAAQSGRYSLHTLTERYGDAVLPQVNVVDMREQSDGSLFSETLKQELKTCFEQGKQAILLLNRRGYQTFVSCRSCGKVLTCPSCSISMTYHRANGKLMCHYCGHMQPMTVRCPECGSEHVRYSGIGTQRVEEELKQLFPDIPVLRMDTDTTMSRFAYEEKFKEFAEGKYRVMIGTQMVAKGLDFPDVSLVGVLSADQSLYAGDYRAYETTFSLLTQVIGRAGRREFPGKAIIQTTVPEHYVIGQASAQDYPSFYNVEIAARRQMKYPPFTELCVFALAGTREAAVKDAAGRLLALLQQTVAKDVYRGLPMIVLDPTPAAVSRMAGKYRYKLLVKLGGTALSRQMVGEVLTQFAADPVNREVTVYADRNPATIL